MKQHIKNHESNKLNDLIHDRLNLDLMKKRRFKTNSKGEVVINKEWLEDLIEYNEQLVDALMAKKATPYDEECFSLELTRALIETPEDALRLFREYRGLTQDKLANLANCSRVMISEIENKKKKGSIDTLKNIAAVLNIDLEDIV